MGLTYVMGYNYACVIFPDISNDANEVLVH